MRSLIVVLCLLCLSASSITWAAELHGVPAPDQGHTHLNAGDSESHPVQSQTNCHVYHCQSASHFTASADAVFRLPPTVTYRLPERAVSATPGILPSPWRPPTL